MVFTSMNRLRSAHEAYVQEVSPANMAASLELCGLLDCCCELLKVKKIIDFGSGISSYVFRAYSKRNSPVDVWSVDDDQKWIEKTRAYLDLSQVSTKNLVMLDPFIGTAEKNFDIVFLDLNFVEVRKNYISMAVDRCRAGGIVIFDDVHKLEFMHEILARTRTLSLQLYDLKALTLDGFGRYALLGIKE
jgi:predicted O-methyltransferase YrrM